MVRFHVARRGSLSLVAHAALASVGWGNRAALLVLPLVSDISRELVPIAGCTHSGRARAHGRLHRSVSLCAASDVCRHSDLCGGNIALARIVVWRSAGAYFYRYTCPAGS